MTVATTWRLDWPTSDGGRTGYAVIKAEPGHFRVDERLALAGLQTCGQVDTGSGEVPGQGEHLFIRVEKCGDNTEFVARELASLSGCKPHDIGLSGLKDRHAVTRQWFSVYRPGMASTDALFITAVAARWSVLAVCRFQRKLRRGEHQDNRFDLVLTDLTGDVQRIEKSMVRLRDQGCPNYFGPQRFGWGGNNLAQAIRLRPGRQRGRKSRDGLYFSAARSWLFNEVLAERVSQGSWQDSMPGEPSESGPTGPLWGDGGTIATDQQEQLERSVVSRHPELEAVFSQTRMKPERRSLILTPDTLEWHWLNDSSLALTFTLMPGQFATSMLADIFEIRDASVTGAGLAEET